MKTFEYYMSLPYKMEIVEDKDEGGFILSFPELPGCLTFADTIDDLLKNSIEAKREWIQAAIDENIEINEPSNTNEFSGQFKLRLPKSLHKELATEAKLEGISMNQYCIYLLSRNMHFKNAK